MTLDINRIKALCFDVDGTISDSDDKWVHQLSQTLSYLKLPLLHVQPEKMARWIIMGMETPGNLLYTFFDRLNIVDDLARIYSRLAQRKKDNGRHDYWIIPGMEYTLQNLKDRYPMTVVSARDQVSTEMFLQQFNLNDLFQAIATNLTCKHTKPFPDPVIWAAHQVGVTPSECLMIGDTTVDILAGKAAGAQTVGVLCGFGSEGELRRAGADLILPSTTELLAVLNSTL